MPKLSEEPRWPRPASNQCAREQTKYLNAIVNQCPRLEKISLLVVDDGGLGALRKLLSLTHLDLGGMVDSANSDDLVKTLVVMPNLRSLLIQPHQGQMKRGSKVWTMWMNHTAHSPPGFPYTPSAPIRPFTLEERHLVAIAGACPDLRELRCQVTGLTTPTFLTLAALCPRLHTLELCGLSTADSRFVMLNDDAITGILETCKDLQYLGLDWKVLSDETMEAIRSIVGAHLWGEHDDAHPLLMLESSRGRLSFSRYSNPMSST